MPMDAPERLGKYEIRGTLGRGAMGTVYDGWDPLIARRVAIKTVALPENPDPETAEEIARFKREAQAAGRLTHPNIVGVYDYGETEGLAYIVMEFVEGPSLKALLDRHERFALPELQRVMEDLLAGLQFSHERGVVHRDIKPANIMLTKEGRAKIADFGIARIEASSMTQAGTMLGTPAYMSPEQFMGQVVDARTDVYAAGVVLYQLLTGERPFEGGLTAIMHKVLNTEPPPPSQLAVTAPAALDPVVRRAMAKRPEDRYPSAAAFAEAIRAALAPPSPRPAVAAEADATLVGPAALHPAPAPTPPPAPTAARSLAARLPLLGGIAAAAVVLVVGGGWFLLRPAAPPSPAPAPTPPPAKVAEAVPAPAPPRVPATPPPPAQPAAPPPPAVAQPADAAAPAPAADVQATAPPPAAGSGPPEAPPVQPAAPPVQPSAPTEVQPVATTAVQPAAPPPTASQPTPVAAPPQAEAPALAPPVATAASGTAPPPIPPPQLPPASPPAAAPAAPVAMAGLAPLRTLLDRADCTRAEAVLQDSGTLSVTGVVDARAVATLRAQADGLAGGRLDWRVQPIDPVFCPALSVLRPIAAGSGLRLTLAGGRTALHDGERIAPRVTMPDFAGELRVDYLGHDGSVVHLYPTVADPAQHVAAQPARRLAAGETLALGDPGPGRPIWEVGPPYGTDMIMAIASSAPLLARLPAQNAENDAAAYLRQLAAAVAVAQKAGTRLAGALLPVDTLPK